MNDRTLWPWTLALALTGMIVLSVHADDDDDDLIANQAIVELVPGITIEEINSDFGTSVITAIESRSMYLLQLPQDYSEHEFELMFEEDPRIEDADLNYETEAAEGQTESFYLEVEPFGFGTQYARNRIGLPLAHDVSTGAGTIVAIVDTGADVTHEVIADQIHAASINLIDGTADVSDVGNNEDDDLDGIVDELVGHGTFVAGLVSMVAPSAELLIIKTLDSDGNASSFSVARAIYYAMDQGADVINLSLATISEYDVLKDAVEDAWDEGVLVIAAPGNLNEANPKRYPAAADEALGIASTDASDVKSLNSNYGDYISLSAPGVDLISAIPGNRYAQWGGTSMSAALVTGGVALLRAHLPNASPGEVDTLLRQTAVDLDAANPQHAGLLGAGRLDLAAALGDIGQPMIGDLNGDGAVGPADLALLLDQWGPCAPPCAADLNDDGAIGPADLALLLDAWN